MDLLKKMYFGELTEGLYEVQLKAIKLVATEGKKEYVEFIFQLPTREFKRNMFEQDLAIFLSHTRRQFSRAEENIMPEDYLKELIKDKTVFKMWVVYKEITTFNGTVKRVQNIMFLPALPVVEIPTETNTDSDEDK